MPPTGGAVVAINHTGYLDFTLAWLPFYRQKLGRKVRFMAKQEVFDHKITGPLMRSFRHIPVDRESGAASYAAAVDNLKAGELVGVYPEATISRSFEIKEFKTGAARMAIEAGVPIIPHVVWGAQRIWTKGHPKKIFRPKVPIQVIVGEPIEPTLPTLELTALLHSRMQHLLIRAQEQYGPHPAASSGFRTDWAAAPRRWPKRPAWMLRKPRRRRRAVQRGLIRLMDADEAPEAGAVVVAPHRTRQG